jgi:hypothetical protein
MAAHNLLRSFFFEELLLYADSKLQPSNAANSSHTIIRSHNMKHTYSDTLH